MDSRTRPAKGELEVDTRLLVTPLSRHSVVHRRSPDLLCQLDDDPFRSADLAKPVDTLVLRRLADEFGAVSPQAVQDVVDALYRERDMTDAQRVRRTASAPLEPTARGTWPARAVRGRRGFASSRCPPGPPRVQRCDRSSVPRPASRHPPRVRAQRRTPSRPQGIDDDADTVHPLNRHAGSPWCDASYSAGYSAGRGHVCFANLLTRAQSEPYIDPIRDASVMRPIAPTTHQRR